MRTINRVVKIKNLTINLVSPLEEIPAALLEQTPKYSVTPAEVFAENKERDRKMLLMACKEGGYDFSDLCVIRASVMEPAGRAIAVMGGANGDDITRHFLTALEQEKVGYAHLVFNRPKAASILGNLFPDLVSKLEEESEDGEAYVVVVMDRKASVFMLPYEDKGEAA